MNTRQRAETGIWEFGTGMNVRHQIGSRRTKGRLFRRVRRQRVKYITVLPSLITILNGVFGFTAIMFASKVGGDAANARFTHFAIAGYMVLMAMFADMLDGRLARMSQSTSSFGGQLDSLCDLVSFGVAPAFLMLKVVESELALPGDLSGDILYRFVWLAALVYISCTAIRLARFNVENDENEAAHMSFAGLPSPAAAGVLVSLVIFHEEELPGVKLLVYALPFFALTTAVLMVSRIRYPHVVNVYLRGKQPFDYLIRVLFFLGLVVCLKQTALFFIFTVYAGGSLLKWLYSKLIRQKSRLAPVSGELAADAHPAYDPHNPQ
jgi:CDP-diacylglycerol--serine O-phosphatidyltransferase